jgi:hypothetical protein
MYLDIKNISGIQLKSLMNLPRNKKILGMMKEANAEATKHDLEKLTAFRKFYGEQMREFHLHSDRYSIYKDLEAIGSKETVNYLKSAHYYVAQCEMNDEVIHSIQSGVIVISSMIKKLFFSNNRRKDPTTEYEYQINMLGDTILKRLLNMPSDSHCSEDEVIIEQALAEVQLPKFNIN